MARRARALALLAAGAAALAGCDQFARVGVGLRDSDGSADAGIEPPPTPIAVLDDPDAGADADGGNDAGSIPTAVNGNRDANDPMCLREVAGCDPIRNLGCNAALEMQCAVDIIAPQLTGYCTFFGPVPPGPVTCFNSGVTESCPPTTACLQNECREVCLCDADCRVGDCCSAFLTESGFRVCAPCP